MAIKSEAGFHVAKDAAHPPGFLALNLTDDKPQRILITVRNPSHEVDARFIPKKVSAEERKGWRAAGTVAQIEMSLPEFSEVLRQISLAFKAAGI